MVEHPSPGAGHPEPSLGPEAIDAAAHRNGVMTDALPDNCAPRTVADGYPV